KELGASVYLPLGEQVLGQRDLVGVTADTLIAHGINYATPEFSKISGDDKLSEKMKEHLIRLHAIQSSEVDKLGPEEFYERFVKASRERSMRLLLVRPLSTASDKPVFALGSTIKELTAQILKDGGGVGQARPFVEPQLQSWALPVIGLGVGLMCAWVILRLKFPPSIPLAGSADQDPPRPLGEVGEARTGRGNFTLLAAAAAIIITLLSISNRGRSFVAIFSGLAFPIAAYLILDTKRKIHPILMALAMTGVSLCGGLAIAGLLNSLGQWVRTQNE
ncbi:MAG: DUF5693 family protein, partial [Armatimonadetes bacterium]|nr:DUF5693 family protein [Armatimonadota bacterium]